MFRCLRGWVTEPEIVVSFTNNTVGDLPSIMQQAKISPLQSLTCHFVSQFVPAVKEVERDRGMKSERLYGQTLILHLYWPTVGWPKSLQSAKCLWMELDSELWIATYHWDGVCNWNSWLITCAAPKHWWTFLTDLTSKPTKHLEFQQLWRIL